MAPSPATPKAAAKPVTSPASARPIRPAPKPSKKGKSPAKSRARRKIITNEEIMRFLAQTPFYDEVRFVLEKGFGTITLEFSKVKNNNGNEHNKLRIETATSSQTQLPLFLM